MVWSSSRQGDVHGPGVAGLRPADLFAEVLANANHLIETCHMFTMTDDLERKDAVLGPNKGYIYHSCLTCKFQGWNWHALGENVATGPGVKAVHKKFMKSSGHRANILSSKYDKVGVGIVVRKGKLWVTELFYG
jgi:hypothetical protein